MLYLEKTVKDEKLDRAFAIKRKDTLSTRYKRGLAAQPTEFSRGCHGSATRAAAVFICVSCGIVVHC